MTTNHSLEYAKVFINTEVRFSNMHEENADVYCFEAMAMTSWNDPSNTKDKNYVNFGKLVVAFEENIIDVIREESDAVLICATPDFQAVASITQIGDHVKAMTDMILRRVEEVDYEGYISIEYHLVPYSGDDLKEVERELAFEILDIHELAVEKQGLKTSANCDKRASCGK